MHFKNSGTATDNLFSSVCPNATSNPNKKTIVVIATGI